MAVEKAEQSLDTLERNLGQAEDDAAILGDPALTPQQKLDRLGEGGYQSPVEREIANKESELAQKKAQELASDLEGMGPAFVKLGQLLSTRPDLLPEPYLRALARLQEDVEPVPYEEVERVVQDELGTRISRAFLEFEQPIAELEGKISELQLVGSDNRLNITEEIERLRDKSAKLTESIYSNLTSWQVVQVARHPQRPYASDYIARIFTDWEELHGDRHFGDDKAIIGGIGRLDGKPVIVIGEEKGRSVQEKVSRNFGMPKPEGYRKALRLMHMAERFKLPVLTLIDTPGAYPGIDSEERGISEANAQNLAVMSRLRTPIICTVIGEGSSGGALAIGVGDHLNMLQYATYFVISPEGCANIIWKTVDKAPLAAEAMGVTSRVLEDLGIVDETIPEPLGGAHRNIEAMSETLRERLSEQVDRYASMPVDELLDKRYQRLMSYGND